MNIPKTLAKKAKSKGLQVIPIKYKGLMGFYLMGFDIIYIENNVSYILTSIEPTNYNAKKYKWLIKNHTKKRSSYISDIRRFDITQITAEKTNYILSKNLTQ